MKKYRVKFKVLGRVLVTDVEASTHDAAIVAAEIKLWESLKVLNTTDMSEVQDLKKGKRLEEYYARNPHLRPAYVKTPSV